MKKALNSKHKLGFVNGSISKPDPEVDPKLTASWQCHSDVISSWILNSVSKEITTSIIDADSAASI